MATDARNRQIKFEENIGELISGKLGDIVAKAVSYAIAEEKKHGAFDGGHEPRKDADVFDDLEGMLHDFAPLLGHEEVRVHFKEVEGKRLSPASKQELAVELGTIIKRFASQHGLEKLEVKYKNHGKQ